MRRRQPYAGLVLAVVTALALLLGTTSSTHAAPTAAATAAATDRQEAGGLRDRIARLPGVVSVRERYAPFGNRYFAIGFRQPVDHRRPGGRTFVQRLGLLHTGFDRPTVMSTSGYQLYGIPLRSQPARILLGNELEMEHRFFRPSRPERPRWDAQLTIRQAATDQHRVVRAFQRLYRQRWITTGASKGGMTATYHRRFFPNDVDGTVAYVAPNDVVDAEDSAYETFLDDVGTPDCRAALTAVQRRVLGPDRGWFFDRARRAAREDGHTWDLVGDPDVAIEAAALEVYFTFWQYQRERDCAQVPTPATSRRELWDWLEVVLPLTSFTDQLTRPYVPYYHQASSQLGAPAPYERPIADLLRHPGTDVPPTLVPDRLRPTRFDDDAMPDVDRWVRTRSTQMLFVYGENDPWSAEPFSCGDAADARRRDCHRFTVPRGNHSARIGELPVADRRLAVRRLMRWADLGPRDPARLALERGGVPEAEVRDARRFGLPR